MSHPVRQVDRPTTRTSSWALYAARNMASTTQMLRGNRCDTLIIGQCQFDMNCLTSPFASEEQLIQLAIGERPEILRGRVIYKPHPLAPEVVHREEFWLKGVRVGVTREPPEFLLSTRPRVITWNSILGFEAGAFWRCPVTVLDRGCFYRLPLEGSRTEVREFVNFLSLNSVRVNQE